MAGMNDGAVLRDPESRSTLLRAGKFRMTVKRARNGRLRLDDLLWAIPQKQIFRDVHVTEML
ncbi:MAG: hypothetical protein V3T49_06020, partial [Dehalococcoidia bacterium]